jgi:hypothetical protein
LSRADYSTHRYLYSLFNADQRLTGIIGPRGTGKTTLMLQYIKEKAHDPGDVVYASMDHLYFSSTKLYDFIEECYEREGIKLFFLDEIHKYENWNQELKNIYDGFPDIRIVFSGSSSLDLIRGSYDLSRRGIIYHLNGMSFREYLYFFKGIKLPVFKLDDLIRLNHQDYDQIAQIERLKGHFDDYLNYGYYPFSLEDPANYHQRLSSIINKVIFEDISNFYQLKTENLVFFKKIIAFLATIPPGEVNINQIAKNMGIDHKTVRHYLGIMKETGLIRIIGPAKTGSGQLKTNEKIFLENTNLYEAVIRDIGFEKSAGTIRELFFISMLENAGYPVFHSSIGDYEVSGWTFEIGGKNKSRSQIRELPDKSFLVKDDILYGDRGAIPLYLFGFLY